MRVAGGRQRALVGFAAFGVFWGAWGAALPALQRRSGADDGELGLAFVLVGLGALVSMRATGVLLDRLGPRLTPVTIALFAAAGMLPGLATSPAVLFAFVVLLGVTSGAMDVAINNDAVREEGASGRPLLNLAHACFSASVVGASVATGLLRAASRVDDDKSVDVTVPVVVVGGEVHVAVGRHGGVPGHGTSVG